MSSYLISTIRKLLPWTTAAIGIAALHLGWLFYSRAHDAREIERAEEARRAEADRKIVEQYGNGKLKIISFYTSPGVLPRGGKGLLCYGVVNAVSVRIDPGIGSVPPSLSRCLEISPSARTEYKLTATGRQGATTAESAAVELR